MRRGAEWRGGMRCPGEWRGGRGLPLLTRPTPNPHIHACPSRSHSQPIFRPQGSQYETPGTGFGPTDNLQRGSEPSYAQRYAMPPPTETTSALGSTKNFDAVIYQPLPGFLTLQLLVDRWIIGRNVSLAEMNATALESAFEFMLTYLLPPSSETPVYVNELFRAEPALVAALTPDIAAWMGPGESFAPQTVEFAPFPITAYTDNAFYTTVTQVFSFFFTIVFLFPVSRLIRGLVAEKETRIREGMRMMGLSDLALNGSWFTTYAILYVAIGASIAVITHTNMFKSTSGGFIFILFTLYGFSTIAYCYLVSVFFSHAKTASTLGVMLFLGGFLCVA